MGGCIEREVPVFNKTEPNKSNQSSIPTSQDALIFRPKGKLSSDVAHGSDFGLAASSRRKKDWDALRRLVTSTEQIKGRTNVDNLWATNPVTVGGLAFAYLAEAANREPSVLSTIALEMVPSILTAINSGQRELSDNALLLICFTVNHISKTTREEIITLGGFKSLITVMNDSRAEPRHVAALISHNLFKNNLRAQQLFLQAGGGRQLVQLLMRESDDENIISELLAFIADLVTISQDGNTKIIREHAEIIQQAKFHDILNSLAFENFRPETIDLADKLVRILAD